MFLGRTDVALAEIRRAQELDPLSFDAHEIGGEGYYFARQYDEAIRMEREASEMDPTNPTPYTDMGDALMQKQMCPDAMKQFVRFEELTGHVQNAVALGKALESSGCRGALKKQLEFYSDRANPDYYPMSAAVNASLLGEKDMAFKFIEQAYQTRQGIIWLKVEPGLDNIRSDPRYAALLQKTGLADGPQPSSR
jgi:tetratricopeptide (TPR) repeat protein